MYLEFMEEYEAMGHMSSTNNKIPDSPHYFIPHQCVLRPQSTSTKLRVVFDASSRTSTQVALNDILMVGPTIQEELYSTLLRFRLHKFALAADVKKMYSQVMVDEADRNFQLIVWRRDPSESLKIFKLNTVTYGTSPAPYLAIRCLMRLGEIAQDSCLKAADLLTGARSVEDLLSLRGEVSQVLQEAGFELAKWFSNCPELSASESAVMPLTADSDVTKTLGVVWLPGKDYFQFRLDDSFLDLRATKRNILSMTARLFDPLGLLCPLVTRAKMLLQELWLRKLDWDESLPMQLQTSWEAFKGTLLQLPKIKVSRFVHTDAKVPAEIHGFADASMRAYGACIYVRTSTAEGFVSRRGIPKKVWCDNATNFVGADRHMREFRARLEEQGGGIATFASRRGCEYAFIPPRAPHFGGLWEAGVKSAKHLFLRTVGEDILTAEELGGACAL
ncbi:uncharacterized protein [Drosophila takahashii]|uniref:uncharacterized protein n=1 Tax=Drosophila takahashii TaxID=29030 RepID=UPI00389941E8